MLITCNINNIAICFYGPLFQFFRNTGQPGPRAYNVSSLSLGDRTFFKKVKGGIKCDYGKKTRNIKFIKANLERLLFQNKIIGFAGAPAGINAPAKAPAFKLFLKKIKRDRIYDKYRNSCQWQ